MTAKPKRRRVIVEWDGEFWKFNLSPNHAASYRTRAEAVDQASRILDTQFHLTGLCSELLVRNKTTGEFSKDRRTYGRDPRKVKG